MRISKVIPNPDYTLQIVTTDFIFKSKYGKVFTKALDELYTNFIAKFSFRNYKTKSHPKNSAKKS
ncbi:hypothetical protein IT568_04315 [bacterium]|nr:hypothetical protein [bacterium]